ncbi:hypothetical protein T4D_3997 [Trichinella pseudospiralis]|uniref:Uncharacterized protein n=1 Tax=Trichinella pseudospiralis TaxID=6337 RepID=A0A0V1FD07_TRIPS|nr:hypothetical protein T4D_3997 [Trichinella pseudospiralis]
MASLLKRSLILWQWTRTELMRSFLQKMKTKKTKATKRARVYIVVDPGFRLSNKESARQNGREMHQSIPARRQIAINASITPQKKRTSLLEVAARYTLNAYLLVGIRCRQARNCSQSFTSQTTTQICRLRCMG